jgi:hypothetical protein
MNRHYKNLESTAAVSVAGPVRLHRVIINTATATAVVKVYDGTSTSGTLVATIDGASKSNHDFGGALLAGGLYVDQTVAASKLTVVYA